MINIRKRIGKLKPATALGAAALFAELKGEMLRLESTGAPMSSKEAKAITKAAFAKPGICAPSTISGALSRAKAAEQARMAASPSPAMGGASVFERFTDDILAELKGLEPGGRASRGCGRANYLSAGEPSPMQEGLGTLYKNQEIIMSDYINWVSSREKRPVRDPATYKRRGETARAQSPTRHRRLKSTAGFSSQRWHNAKESFGSASQSHQLQPVPPYSAPA